MITTKRYIIFALLALLTIIISIVFTRQKRQSTQISVPKYIDQLSGNLPVNIAPEVDFQAPTKAPLLQAEPHQITTDEAQTIATTLGFNDQPSTFDDAREGTKYFWTNANAYLIITPKTSSVSYGLNSLPITTDQIPGSLSQDILVDKANSFLFNNFFLKENSIKFTSINYLYIQPQTEIVKETAQQEANVYQLNFTYQDAEYPIIALPSFQPLIHVQLLPNGTITRVNLIKVEGIVKTNENYTLKSLNDVYQSLNEAVLFSLKNDYIGVKGLDRSNIEDIKLDRVEFVYLLEESQTKILKPLFLLYGEAKIKNSTADQAVFYLSAIKNP